MWGYILFIVILIHTLKHLPVQMFGRPIPFGIGLDLKYPFGMFGRP